jgi:hypothetical protein
MIARFNRGWLVFLVAAWFLLSLAGTPANASAHRSPSVCAPEAGQIFLEHLSHHHLQRPTLGATDAAADPAGWVGMHEALFKEMGARAAGSCSAGDGGHHHHHGG